MALTKIGKEGITGISNASDATAITIGSDENVGIGLASTSGVRLEVKTTSSDHLVARFENSHASGSYGISVKAGDDSGNYPADFANKSGTSLMRVRGDGNVGIGTTSPSCILHASTGSSGSGLIDVARFENEGTSANDGARIQLTAGSSTSGAGIGCLGDALNSAHLVFHAGGNTERMRLTSSGSLEIASGGFKAIGIYNNTTGTGANLVVDSAGGFARSTSSRRYKNTINDATHGLTELLKLRPVTYKGNNDGDTVFGGLIAEEVHDAGLTEFVTYNDDNEPDALAYGNMVSLCIKAIKELSAKNDALETKNDALEARIKTLEDA